MEIIFPQNLEKIVQRLLASTFTFEKFNPSVLYWHANYSYFFSKSFKDSFCGHVIMKFNNSLLVMKVKSESESSSLMDYRVHEFSRPEHWSG